MNKNTEDEDGDTIYLDSGSSREESAEMYGKQKDATDDSFSDEDFAGSGDYVYDDEDEIEDYESDENKNNIYDDIKRSQLNQVRG